jgi:predicted dithiol-disulfide oxidoreductase (DUF899 family)
MVEGRPTDGKDQDYRCDRENGRRYLEELLEGRRTTIEDGL